MKKNIFLLLILFLLTGCSCRYDITINKDLTIDEEIIIYGTNRLYNAYYKTNKVDVLKENLENYLEELNENNYEYKLIEEGEPHIIITKKYQDIENYLNNSLFFNDYFDEISYNKEGNIVSIETMGFNPNEEDNPDRFYVEKLEVNIKNAYEINDSNSLIIDDNTNTYKYNLLEDSNDFKIFLSYDLSKRFNPHKKNLIYIVIAVLIIIITWVAMFFVNRKKKI